MKILSRRPWTHDQKPFLSMEFFPPKEEAGLPDFWSGVERLRSLNPLFASVTYGAGGGTRDKTVEIAARMQQSPGWTAMAHLTCVDADEQGIARFVEDLLRAGVDNVLALRGDSPGNGAEPGPGDFRHASDLVAFIRRRWPEVGLAVACYPEAHPDSPTIADDLEWTRYKLDAGADFAVSQLFFDIRRYRDFVLRLQGLGVEKPVLPGVLPLLSMQTARRILCLCGVSIPLRLYLELRDADMAGGARAVRRKGITMAREQIRGLLALGVPGIHLYTLNNAEACLEILEPFPELGARNNDPSS